MGKTHTKTDALLSTFIEEIPLCLKMAETQLHPSLLFYMHTSIYMQMIHPALLLLVPSSAHTR